MEVENEEKMVAAQPAAGPSDAGGGGKSARERLVERMRARHPDLADGDDDWDDGLYSRIGEDYDAYDEEIAGYRDTEDKMREMFSRDPRSAAFLTRWRGGADPVVELVRLFGDDFVEQMRDPARQEALAAASKEYLDRVEEQSRYEEDYKRNITESRSVADALMEERGLTDDDMDAAVSYLVGVMADAVVGRFSRESLLMALNAVRHDRDVAEAAGEAEVRGRNARIQETLRRRKSGDGTPAASGGGGGGMAEPRRARSIFDQAAAAR